MSVVLSIDRILVSAAGVALLLFIYNFFFRRQAKAVVLEKSMKILVNGGYNPEVIVVPKGKLSQLIFERTDPNACLEEVLIPHFGLRRYLPLNQQVVLEVLPEESGEFPFSCGMNMFQGKIIVP